MLWKHQFVAKVCELPPCHTARMNHVATLRHPCETRPFARIACRRHLEQLRSEVEAAEFRLRGSDRRQAPRGPDRRNEKTRGRARTGHAIRQLAQEKPSVPLSVTVSVGVAASTREKSLPDLVLQAADKAMYRAKANGRNRVETASSSRRRSGMKTAGIA
jgi:GGDEF domain-containing protein